MIEHSYRLDHFLMRISEADLKKRLRIDPLVKLIHFELVLDCQKMISQWHIFGAKMHITPLEPEQ